MQQPPLQQSPTCIPPPTTDLHCLCLEETLTKLRKALDDWRTYSYEYEAFREEVLALPSSASPQAILEAGLDLQAIRVDELEIKSLLGGKLGIVRGRDQVVSAVSHRISYVDENIEKLRKQIDAIEAKIGQPLISEPDQLKNEDGLSVMDIQEELDEDGNVTHAWVNGKDPEAPSRALDITGLLKLGKLVKDADETKTSSPEPRSKDAPLVEVPPPLPPPPPPSPQTESKSVPPQQEKEDREVEGAGYVRVFNDPKEPPPEEWVQEVPGETEEETKLRKEMLRYNMQEIGAVVAELNLEEEGDYYGYEDDCSEEEGEEDDDTEDEDKWGRTTRQVVTDNYRREMEALEQRLTGKVPTRKEAAVEATETPPPPPPPAKAKAGGKLNGKKSVSFSEHLDIAPTPKPPSSARQPAATTFSTDRMDMAPDENDALPFLERLLERQEIANAGPTIPIPNKTAIQGPKPKAPSIFKREKASTPSPLRQVETPPKLAKEAVRDSILELPVEGTPTVPVQPPSSLPSENASRPKAAKLAGELSGPSLPSPPPAIMSDFVVEREPSFASQADPPDELDPFTHRQEVAAHFYQLRSKMIHQQGGFMETDEERAVVPLDDGRPKVSRFKAARLKGLGQ